jgi:RsiW-degrading membrane proteinase PrsW (M82 family)
MLPSIFTLLLGFCLGFLPSLIWLVFWLREDPHPEPTKTLVRAFIAGMCAVPGAIIFQYIVLAVLGLENVGLESLYGTTLIVVILLWAGIEEVCKYAVCSRSALSKKEDDEPLDPVIYLITAALGFAAVENVLFILSPLIDGNFLSTVTAVNMRFMGATLVHILGSGVVGMALGLTFYKKKRIKVIAGIIGVILATALHSVFNLLILRSESSLFGAFMFLWIMIIILIVMIEKLKYLKP